MRLVSFIQYCTVGFGTVGMVAYITKRTIEYNGVTYYNFAPFMGRYTYVHVDKTFRAKVIKSKL
jgi:hypothetical protein